MENPKRAAGRRAVDFVRDGMVLGLGTGSTVRFALERLAERIEAERLKVRGVPTSHDTETKARALGIPLATLGEVNAIDLTIDGADEIDAEFRMIKGGGGALLREKVVASISRREVIVVGRDKVVDRLGTTFALPVELVPFAAPVVARRLEALGCTPKLRMLGAGPFETDNGNTILDCRFPDGIADPAALETAIHAIPGVVEVGLFLGLAHAMVIGEAEGECEVREKAARGAG